MKMIKSYYWLTLTLILGLIFNSCDEKKNNKNETFYFENGVSSNVYTPLIDMKLNGVERTFIVDTGANMSLIDDSFYKDNENDFQFLSEIDMTLNGVAGTKNYKAYYILGGLGDDNSLKYQFLTSDLSGVRNSIKTSTGIDIIGILGADYLNRYGFTVDFVHKAIYRFIVPLDSLKTL